VTPRQAAAAVGGCLTAIGAAALGGPPLIRSAHSGRSIGILNELLRGSRYSANEWVEFYLNALMALALGVLVLAAIAWGLARWAQSGRHLSSKLAVAAVAILAAAIAADRLGSYDEAIERDLAAYMTIADGMVQGRTLYVDLWDHKPPAIHATYAAAVFLAGPTPLAIWLLGVTAALATLAGCFAAGRCAGGNVGGVAAAAAWMLFGGDAALQANQPNVEVFMNLCLVWAFAGLLHRDGLNTKRYVLLGLAFLVASLYKTVVAPVAVLLLGTAGLMILAGARAGDGGWRPQLGRVVAHISIAALVVIAGWLLVASYFWAVGRLPAFYDAVFGFNQEYAGSLTRNLANSLRPSPGTIGPMLAYLPLLIVVFAAAIRGARERRRWQWTLLLAYLGAAWLAVALPGRMYPHYYQLLLPPAAIGLGWLVAAAVERRSQLAIATCCALLWAPLAARLYQGTVPLEALPIMKYGNYGYDCLEVQRIGPWVNQRLSPSATLFHWGPEPGVYYYSGRQSPVPFVYNMPLQGTKPRSQRYVAMMLTSLQKADPAMIVAREVEMRAIDHPIESWIDQPYERIQGPAGVERFAFYAKRDRQTVRVRGGASPSL
jgi:hypothetical protein